VVPPGSCLVLLTADRSAVWVTSWPLAAYVRHAWPGAWRARSSATSDPTCTCFWPDHLRCRAQPRAVTRCTCPGGIVTFVDPAKTCHKRAACGGSRHTLTRVNGSRAVNSPTLSWPGAIQHAGADPGTYWARAGHADLHA